MNHLIFDVGNTLIKIGVVKNNKIVKILTILTSEYNIKSLQTIKIKINKVFIGFVNDVGLKIVNDIKKLFHINPFVYKPSCFSKSFDLSQFNQKEIGVDILAFSYYLKNKCKHSVGICAGTATFIVLVNNNKIPGVLLLPNITKSFNHTFKKTQLINHQNINVNQIDLSLAHTTKTAINNGFAFNLFSLINGAINLYAKSKAIKCCVTGGYIPSNLTFQKQLCKHFDNKLFFVDNAVLLGYLQFNNDNHL
ncbi:MAG: type III pantothenate kinase [Mycoplasmataceae bacterium]|jgi:pantothenate kinase type III|nr:type III pantothenate kinase [Mycoplasmataceae bacterium]